ncbi:hypothetical protein BCR43DRAFT_432228 [Syncephalastrum racemosum]|uniref:NmrA-like domain-containing protein n=1 Tax=Syncephalastrum racemosum TaxID=13706 RepID=A0A1X2HRV4_SYNRA|nr:hypothetical protein BCR43DRAFT_432228 [Syncephalastrum racemosum]
MLSTERVYILGATGNVGKVATRILLRNNVPVTAFVRSVDKAKELFPEQQALSIVKGDYDDLTPFKNSIAGHTRLLLSIADLARFKEIKCAFAEASYAAGVKQIVDISSSYIEFTHYTCWLGQRAWEAEVAVRAIPDRGAFVSLRPTRFMSNLFIWGDLHTIELHDALFDARPEDHPVDYISPNDVGAVAAIILQDPIDKHGDMAYDMKGEVLTGRQKAKILSRALGRDIRYQTVSPQKVYETLAEHVPHPFAYSVAIQREVGVKTVGLSILLGREPETFEEYLTSVKSSLA